MKPLFAILLLSLSTASYGALNKWVDADGNVHYSDEPPPDAKTQKLNVPRAPAGAKAQKSYIEREAELKKTLKAKEEAEKKAAQEQENNQTKQKNCESARANLRTFQSQGPLTTYNAKGETVFMSDAERQQHTEESRKQISEFCGEE